MLEEVVDVWLPDFKYMDSKLAFAYSRAKITRKLPGQQSGEMMKAAGPVHTMRTVISKKV